MERAQPADASFRAPGEEKKERSFFQILLTLRRKPRGAIIYNNTASGSSVYQPPQALLSLGLCISIPTILLDDQILSKDSTSISHTFPRASVQQSRQDPAERGATFCPACPRGSAMHYVRHLSVDKVLTKCPLPALVIGNPLPMNNDRHQGAKCPVQDTVGISLLTGGEQHLFGC